MTRLVSVPFLPFILLTPMTAPLTSADAAEPIQVVQTGDNALSCQALATEISSLNTSAALASPTQAAAKPQRRGFGGLFKVLGSAAPFVPGVGGMAGSLMMATAGAAQSGATQSRMADVEAAGHDMAMRALAGPTPAEQRRERLTSIFDAKHC